MLGLALTFKTTSRIKKTSQFERHIKTLRSNNYLSGTIQVSLKTIFQLNKFKQKKKTQHKQHPHQHHHPLSLIVIIHNNKYFDRQAFVRENIMQGWPFKITYLTFST